jgi:hypothetical protein
MSNLTPEQKRKEYLDELKYLRDGERDANQTLDRTILTLTAAAFGLSITISGELVPSNARPQEQWILFISWLAFALSLIVTLISFQTSVRSWREEQEYLNESYRTGVQAPGNRPSVLTGGFNTASVILSITGIVAFAVYAWLNLPK